MTSSQDFGGVLTSQLAENQFFISNPGEGGPAIKNRIAEALVERILRAEAEGAKFRVSIRPQTHSIATVANMLLGCRLYP